MKEKDKFFLSLAYFLTENSKDKKTCIGAVVVDEDDIIVSTGWNSFPRKIDDTIKERQEKPEKYYWFAHAERNAIYNAARKGTSLKGCTMYTNGTPCCDCAIAIIQAGIKKVVVDKYWNVLNSEKWEEHANRTKIMFKEAGVELVEYDGYLYEQIYGKNSGIKRSLEIRNHFMDKRWMDINEFI